MNVKATCVWLLALVAAVGIGSASATPLAGRDINRNAVAANDASAIYLWDQDLGITWLRDANVNGRQLWLTQYRWAQNLVTGTGANAISDWRLPSVIDSGTPGCNFAYLGTDCGFNVDTSGSEMAHLFYVTLGNKASCAPSTGSTCIPVAESDYGLRNVGDFLNMQESYPFYWLGSEKTPGSASAWLFITSTGNQPWFTKSAETFYAMAVRPGDVLAAQVPEPESLMLCLTGVACLGLIRRRRAIGTLAL